jgi:GNAT superfamily N-acetyltransferase
LQINPSDIPEFRPVTASNWADFEALFEGRGGPKNCWCMVWRNGPNGKAPSPEKNAKRAAITALVERGTPIGILGYLKEQPVAWCAIAPRSTFRDGLAADRPGDADLNLWSLVCFFVASPYRKRGLFASLLAAAESEARRNGADVIEAYPVAPDSPSYRFGGFVPNFEAAGYTRVGSEGLRRIVVRKSLE